MAKEKLDNQTEPKEDDVLNPDVTVDEELDAIFGAMDDDDDGDDDEEESGEEDAEDQPETVEPEKKHMTSKEEAKIIAQKKELQKLQKEKQELERKLAEKETVSEQKKLADSFVEQGYDEDTAKNMALSEIRIKKLEQRQIISDFRIENEEVFAKYPQAKTDIPRIMKIMENTDEDAETVCAILFGKSKTPDYEQRALDAAKGLSTRETDTTASKVSQAERSSAGSSDVALTPSELRLKRWLEKNYNEGEKLTVKQFREHTSKLSVRP